MFEAAEPPMGYSQLVTWLYRDGHPNIRDVSSAVLVRVSDRG